MPHHAEEVPEGRRRSSTITTQASCRKFDVKPQDNETEPTVYPANTLQAGQLSTERLANSKIATPDSSRPAAIVPNTPV